MQARVRPIVPRLSSSKHKGQAGRVLVVGGCQEYTGAPYFAGISALRGGADMVHVVCTPHAGVPIKSYSPDLIVVPTLSTENRSLNLVNRVHVLAIGSGLGRDEPVLSHAAEFIHEAKNQKLPIVIDGDAIHLVSTKPKLVQGYDRALLTPNGNEYKNLARAFELPEDVAVQTLAERIGVTILQKGERDKVAAPNGEVVEVEHKGSKRRCAGQGDVLAGLCATFMCWAYQDNKDSSARDRSLLAAYFASHITRCCASKAFSQKFRSMIASDIVSEIPAIMQEHIPCNDED